MLVSWPPPLNSATHMHGGSHPQCMEAATRMHAYLTSELLPLVWFVCYLTSELLPLVWFVYIPHLRAVPSGVVCKVRQNKVDVDGAIGDG